MLIIAVLASTALVLVTRAYFGTKISPVEMVVQFVIAFAICAGFFYSLRYVSATDYEILNGEVLTKNAITKECGRYWSRSEDPFCLTHRTRKYMMEKHVLDPERRERVIPTTILNISPSTPRKQDISSSTPSMISNSSVWMIVGPTNRHCSHVLMWVSR